MKKRFSAGTVGFPMAVIAVVAMMVVPMPAIVLDMLIAVNIGVAVLILLASMNAERPLDLASFPSLLLITTLFRLGLNVSSTRLILTTGEAGSVIHAFGSFVIGGSVVVGLVIFLILVVIQFVVITNGAGRVAEVAARFTLDAMPGKQMAIDADLNAGLMTEAEARQRREEVAGEADFYGAMDGSSKFIKGDAIATIVITAINLVGGLIIGVVQHHLPIGEAAMEYSVLTVGDGLVSQIPALLISVASGIIVTRSAGQSDLGSSVVRQFSKQHKVIRMGGISLIVLALLPGMPKLPFLLVGGGLVVLGRRLSSSAAAAPPVEVLDDAPPPPSLDDPEEITRSMQVEPLGLELAVDLIELVEASQGGDLLDRVKALRRKLALELGIVIPSVRTRDNLDLPPHTYVILVHGVEVARGTAPPGQVLVISDDLDTLPGPVVAEPVFGLPAKWVPVELRRQAEMTGGTVVDRPSVVTTHLAEVARRQAGELLSRQGVRALLDLVRESSPAVVEELQAAQVSTGEVQRVLQELLAEGVAVRDLVRILEALGERSRQTRDPDALVEAVRASLGPAISSSYASDGHLPAITLEPLAEQALHGALRVGDQGPFLALGPDAVRVLVEQANDAVDRARNTGVEPVLVCGAAIRRSLRRLLASAMAVPPAVLAYTEIGSHLQVDALGMVSVDELVTA